MILIIRRIHAHCWKLTDKIKPQFGERTDYINTKVMFSSETDDWATPNDYFEELNREFSFTLDPCASENNHKCEKWFSKSDDGLSKSWANECVFCNPPYGREIKDWVRKSFIEAQEPNTKVVMLIPARTDTKWFHEYIYNNPSASVRFIKGRLKFGNAKANAPFPSMVVIFKGADTDK